MRVFFLPSLIAPVAEGRCFGGAEMAALALAEAVAERGCAVTLVAPEGSRGRGLEVWTAERTAVLRPGGEALGPSLPSPFPEVFARLERAAAGGALDVLHLHLLDAEALAAADRLARSHPRLVVVATLHMAALFPDTTEAVRGLLSFRSPIRLTAPSAFAARSYGEGVEVVPNGVEVSSIPFAAEAPADGRLAWAGRRSKEKGMDAALEIARRAGRPITICGPNAPESAAASRTGPSVRDLGARPRAEMGAIYAAAAATLVTSTIPESQSLVALESLAGGTPVIAFDAGALREVIDPGETGFLVPAGDVEAAARAVQEIGAISRRRCRETAKARFDHARSVDRFLALYRGAA